LQQKNAITTEWTARQDTGRVLTAVVGYLIASTFFFTFSQVFLCFNPATA